jgi:import inner membrane translocase subunit TIM9
MDLSQIPEAQRGRIVQHIEEKQAKQFMSLFTFLVDNCFSDCVQEFTSKVLTDKEVNCTRNCTDKLLKMTNRIGKRMSEHSMGDMGMGAISS